MNIEDVKEVVYQQIDKAEDRMVGKAVKSLKLHLFDCPNCGHTVVATEVQIKTGNTMTIYGYDSPEYIHGNQCLTCGKKFTQLPPKDCWEEWRG